MTGWKRSLLIPEAVMEKHSDKKMHLKWRPLLRLQLSKRMDVFEAQIFLYLNRYKDILTPDSG